MVHWQHGLVEPPQAIRGHRDREAGGGIGAGRNLAIEIHQKIIDACGAQAHGAGLRTGAGLALA